MPNERADKDQYALRQTEALEKIATALVSVDGKLNIIVAKLDWLAQIQGSSRPR